MSAAAGSGISEEALKNLQDSIEKLQEAAAELVEEESILIQAVGAENVAAVGPQSESQVGNSQAGKSENEKALELVVSEIDRIRKEIAAITKEINKLLGISEGGRRRRRATRRRYAGRRKRTLRR
jgi:gas vesicle protein